MNLIKTLQAKPLLFAFFWGQKLARKKSIQLTRRWILVRITIIVCRKAIKLQVRQRRAIYLNHNNWARRVGVLSCQAVKTAWNDRWGGVSGTLKRPVFSLAFSRHVTWRHFSIWSEESWLLFIAEVLQLDDSACVSFFFFWRRILCLFLIVKES